MVNEPEEKSMGISIWQLLIVLGIVILLFGTKKLRNIGGDLGNAINSFKKAVKSGEQDADKKTKTRARLSMPKSLPRKMTRSDS